MDSTTSDDLAFATALDCAERVRRGDISPLELTQFYLDRIAADNNRLGCYVTVAEERAIATATAQTERWKTGDREALPPFFGVPISIKDLTPVAGLPWLSGMAALRDRVADRSLHYVEKIEAAGFIILGKTATSQLGSMPFTEPPGLPPARNPWNPDYTPGGSSGGAAAAVAAGLCPVAQGSDGGGSVRGPASCCGLVGLKPSRGRISYAPDAEHLMGMATAGPLARTVADAAALLDVMAGYVPGDPYWLPAPERSFLEQTRQDPPKLRVAIATELPGWTVDAECQAAVTEMGAQLEALGHTIAGIDLPLEGLEEPFQQMFAGAIAASSAPPDVLSPINRWLMEQAGTAGEMWRAIVQVKTVARRLAAFLEPWDALVLPTFAHPIVKVGEWAHLSPPELFEVVTRWVVPCPPFNASGQPAIALPTGFDRRGLPLGVQVVGRPGADGALLQLAAQIERARPGCHHRPPHQVG